MPKQRCCDFCGHPEAKLEIDADGLWICPACRAKLTLPPASTTDGELPDAIRKLGGENAYDEDRYMSTWTFATQWADGTTVWRAHDGEAIAIVGPDDSVRIQPA